MGGAYQATYCRKKFRSLYNAVMRKVIVTLLITLNISSTVCIAVQRLKRLVKYKLYAVQTHYMYISVC